ncbi:FAD-binding oxidoreductase [Verrucomicrobiaceae bacterium 227]
MKRRQFLVTSLVAGLPFILKAEGRYLGPEDEGYDEARQLFNSDLTPRPAYIAKCRSEDEVQAAVIFAREKGLAVSVKSGGHCFIGSSMSEGSLVVDLAGLSQRVYLPESKRLLAGPGIKLGTLYDVLLPQGRILPAGSCAGVGLGGLTLGGGYGLFARQWGLTSDHLERVKMVNGQGGLVDSNDDPDLLWACRGGGNGNFGVVTSMEFETRPAPKTFGAQRFVATKLTPRKAIQLMRSWFAIAAELPEPMFSAFVFNGSQISILLTSSYRTTGPAFRKAAGALQKAGLIPKSATNSPIGRALKRYYGQTGPLPFYNVSGGFYHGYDDLAGSAELIAERVIGTPGLIFQVNTLGGAITRGPDSAYPHREYPFMGEIQAYWNRESQRDGLVAAVTELRKGIGAKAHYRNYPDITLEDYREAYYGASLTKLQELKKRYDPENLIRHAQSV